MSDYASGGYKAADVLVGLIEFGAKLGEPESAVADVEWSGGYDSNSKAENVLLLENGERYRVTVEYVPSSDGAAIAKADRQLRKELEAIEDPKLRKECLDAL